MGGSFVLYIKQSLRYLAAKHEENENKEDMGMKT